MPMLIIIICLVFSLKVYVVLRKKTFSIGRLLARTQMVIDVHI